MVQLGSTKCSYSSRFKILITAFSVYIISKKKVKNLYTKLFSIEKTPFKLYHKVNFHIVPKFMLKTVTFFQLCINILYDETRSRSLFLYKSKTTFLSNQSISNNLEMDVCWAYNDVTISHHPSSDIAEFGYLFIIFWKLSWEFLWQLRDFHT